MKDPEPSPARSPREFPRWAWLWLPLAVALVPYVSAAIDRDFYERWIRTELGFNETLTAVVLLAAVVTGIAVVRRGRSFPAPWFRWWLVLITIGCFYDLGEEISWGQHYFGWATPEALEAINEQGETNLHNIGGWSEFLLDQGPRGLLTLAALVGGVVAPLVLRRRRLGWDPRTQIAPWLWPTVVCLPVSALALVSNLPRKIAADLGTELPSFLDVAGGGEKECFLALFLFFYLLSILVRSQGADRPALEGRG